jgi:hypothetical protein
MKIFTFEQFTNESLIKESHFKVGDKVKMSHGGVGVVKSLDKEDGADDEAYYNIELPNGDVMKHAPNELEKVVNEAKFKPMGLSKDETLKVAKTYAEAISKLEGKKCTVNMNSLEEDSFDLDLPGDEYAGGSYSIDSDGNVYNDGMGTGMKIPPIYGKYNDSVDTIVKNIQKLKL